MEKLIGNLFWVKYAFFGHDEVEREWCVYNYNHEGGIEHLLKENIQTIITSVK